MGASAAPINGDDAMREQFSKADKDDTFGYMSITVNLNKNKFQVARYAEKKDSDESTFEMMVGECRPKAHRYFIIRDPTVKNTTASSSDPESKEEDSSSSSNMYILIHYAPDLSPVKERMIYASSRPSLKAFLGPSSFSEDYHCSSTEELSMKQIVDARTLHHKIDFRSEAEIEKAEAEMDSVATTAKSAVMKSLPIEVQDSAKAAIEAYKSGKSKLVFLSLAKGSQAIEGEEKVASSLAGIKGLLSETEPKYLLFQYAKSSNQDNEEHKEQMGSKMIFGYFCPEKADRKHRFTYSTCKANVVQYCSSVGLEFYSKVELTSLSDLKEEYMDYHVFPVREKKEVFAMPKAPKQRSKAKKKGRKKINMDDLE